MLIYKAGGLSLSPVVGIHHIRSLKAAFIYPAVAELNCLGCNSDVKARWHEHGLKNRAAMFLVSWSKCRKEHGELAHGFD